jgi:8-oxo-dGTP pyrophosphatase MutT (NUDIX family)
MAWIAYHFKPGRILFPAGPPREGYDFISTLARGNEEALKRELRNELGFVGRLETREVDVLALKVRNPKAAGLQQPIIGSSDDSWWQR